MRFLGASLIFLAAVYLYVLLTTSLGVSVIMPVAVSVASSAMVAPTWEVLFGLAVFLAAILPFVGLLCAGIRLLIGRKLAKWRTGLVILILWLVSLVVFGAFIVKIALIDPEQIRLLRTDIIEALGGLRNIGCLSI